MAKKQTISRLAQAAALVDQLIHAIDTEGLSRREAAAAAAQVLGLVQSLSLRGDPDAAVLKAALGRLAERLALAKDDPAAPEVPAAETSVAGSRFAKRLKRLAMIVTAGAVLTAPMAAAARETGAGLAGALMGSSAAYISRSRCSVTGLRPTAGDSAGDGAFIRRPSCRVFAAAPGRR